MIDYTSSHSKSSIKKSISRNHSFPSVSRHSSFPSAACRTLPGSAATAAGTASGARACPINRLHISAKTSFSGNCRPKLGSLDETMPGEVELASKHDLSQRGDNDPKNESHSPSSPPSSSPEVAAASLSTQSEAVVKKKKKKCLHSSFSDDMSVASKMSTSDASGISARLEQRSKARRARKEAEESNALNQEAKRQRELAHEEAKKEKEVQQEKDRQVQEQMDKKKSAREQRMQAIRERIAREKEEARLAEERQKQETAKSTQKAESTESARRERAHQWYVRCGMVSRQELIKRMEVMKSNKSSGSGSAAFLVTIEDIDLLPWDNDKKRVNAASMMRLKLGR